MDRIMFTIRGNNYRLAVAVAFATGTVGSRWIGSHTLYDRIDGTEVAHGGRGDADRHRRGP